MNQWLILGGIMACAGIGSIGVVIGISIGRWQSLALQQSADAAHREQVHAVEEMLTQMRQEQQTTTSELTAAKQTVRQQEARLTSQKEMLAATQRKLTQAAEAHAELTTRTQELEATRDEYQALQEQQAALQSELAALQHILGEREAALAQANADMTALREQIATLAADKERITAQAELEAKQVQEAHARILEEKEDVLARTQQEVSDLQTEIKELADARQQATAQVTNLEAQIAAAKAEIEELNTEAKQTALALDKQIQLHEKVAEQVAALHRQLRSDGEEDDGEDGGRDDGDDSENDGGNDSGNDSEGNGETVPQQQVTNSPDPEVLFAENGGGMPKAIPPKIEQFLAARGITIQNVPAEMPFDPILNSLAQHLGAQYESVKPLYQRIKRNMQQGNEFTLSLKDQPPGTISRICSFAGKLHRVAFLEEYHYRRSPYYLLRARPTQKALAQNFFSGDWLERYVLQLVQSAVGKLAAQVEKGIDFGYTTNPQITLSNGQEGELDILLHVNERIYWIETKSGDYQQHIDKYSKLARVMNLDATHAMMVLPDIEPSHSATLTDLFHMKVYALNEFEQGLSTVFQQEFA